MVTVPPGTVTAGNMVALTTVFAATAGDAETITRSTEQIAINVIFFTSVTPRGRVGVDPGSLSVDLLWFNCFRVLKLQD
jgi:hypothetical protein